MNRESIVGGREQMARHAVRCRHCGSGDGTLVVDLGRQPGSEMFPMLDASSPDPLFPLRLWLCRCGLAQLADDASVPEDPQGTQPEALTRQAAHAVERLAAAGMLVAGGTVTEFASPHGGTWLPLVARLGLIAARAGEPADLVIDCCFGVMHAADQAAAFRDRAAALKPGGLLLVQFHSLASMLAQGEWNAIRHGHYAYYSVPSMRRMLRDVGLTACSGFWFPLYGGTVLLAARREGSPDEALEALTADEISAGVLDPSAVGGLGCSVRSSVTQLVDWLEAEAAAGRRVFGYSAASRAVALLCSASVDRTLLAGVADLAPSKHGRRMPGTDIPVISPQQLLAEKPDTVLLFVPDLLDEVRVALPGIEAAGGRWVPTGLLDLSPEAS